MVVESELVAVIVAIIGLASAFLSAKYGKEYADAKNKAGQLVMLINDIYEASKDDRVTEEEFQKIADDIMVFKNSLEVEK